jgi:hypothetical protein
MASQPAPATRAPQATESAMVANNPLITRYLRPATQRAALHGSAVQARTQFCRFLVSSILSTCISNVHPRRPAPRARAASRKAFHSRSGFRSRLARDCPDRSPQMQCPDKSVSSGRCGHNLVASYEPRRPRSPRAPCAGERASITSRYRDGPALALGLPRSLIVHGRLVRRRTF